MTKKASANNSLDAVATALDAGDMEIFWSQMAGATEAATDFVTLLRLAQLRKKAGSRVAVPAAGSRLKLAVLADYGSEPFTTIMSQLAWPRLGELEIFCAMPGSADCLVLADHSELWDFAPQAILYIPRLTWPPPAGSPLDEDALNSTLAECIDTRLAIANILSQRLRGHVIIANEPLPADDLFGGRSLMSRRASLRRLNVALDAQLPADVNRLDLEYLSGLVGFGRWEDPQAWFERRQLGNEPFLIATCREIVRRLAPSSPKKLLIIDLDNTIWAGTLGDVGPEGIEVGATSPRGDAYAAFQTALHHLARRGVLLAIASKNDPQLVDDAFARRPDMPLRRDDFVAIRCSFEPKHETIQSITRELGLDLSAVVFIDDNPAEIDIVRGFLPEVETLCLDQDPAWHVTRLTAKRWFPFTTPTKEDFGRTQSYQADENRTKNRVRYSSLNDYLDSLEMKLTIRPFSPDDLRRVEQLCQRTNQFNLTLLRPSHSELRDLLEDVDTKALVIELSDRFGDYGLISFLTISRSTKSEVEIGAWVMSCRVFERGLETALLNELIQIAKAWGGVSMRVAFRPTSRSAYAQRRLAALGFQASPSNVDFLTRSCDTLAPELGYSIEVAPSNSG